ncbi:MAG: hypothetical protein ACLVJ6_03320 [Merdibacter sp.]
MRHLYESALLVQKLLYLYTGIKEEHMLAHHQLPGYLCIFRDRVYGQGRQRGVRHAHAYGAAPP